MVTSLSEHRASDLFVLFGWLFSLDFVTPYGSFLKPGLGQMMQCNDEKNAILRNLPLLVADFAAQQLASLLSQEDCPKELLQWISSNIL